MEAPGGFSPIALVWRRQNVWSQAAVAQKRSIGRSRSLALAFGIATAVLGTLASQLMDVSQLTGRLLAVAAALTGAAVPLAAGRGDAQATQDWIRLRAVSESLKSEAYTYLAGVTPYRDAGAELRLRERLAELELDAVDLARHTTGLQPVERGLPRVRDFESYLTNRVDQQIQGYYRPQALRMHDRLVRVRRAEVGLSLLSAGLGSLAAVSAIQQVSGWIAVVATASTAVAAHAASAKFAYQELEYARTASELAALLVRWGTPETPTEGAEDDFVARCEQIISVQNDAWMVKWTTA
ncbi:DUF4231 domain-containing protein [Kitasatospora sp. NBC_01250]|uniref:DUF4231 domain-containing protein n=1 Tax=Kitasatospora sp. NBC_01250 TaxID=2903571 RepID=UPI002E30BC93|nr:DUF4231 domain-containing protein [Kitasatospora sp. NBC_01250]